MGLEELSSLVEGSSWPCVACFCVLFIVHGLSCFEELDDAVRIFGVETLLGVDSCVSFMETRLDGCLQ